MKKVLIYSLTALAVISAAAGCGRRGHGSAVDTVTDPRQDSVPALGFWVEDYTMQETTVRSGETFTGLMTRLGMDSKRALEMAYACDSVFDVRKMRAGNRVEAYYPDSLSQDLQYVIYDHNRVHRTVFSCTDSLAAWTYDRPVQTVRKYADVTISSSLWNDMTRAGSSPLLIIKLSDIYAWTVDFFGLQKDDRFRVIYEQRECEGELIAIDTICFARFTRGENDLFAIMLDQGDGGNVYWNEKGESMRKAFLKAPLEFKRISSGFSYHRKHPVTGQVKAHTGVDYAAPSGTPVVSIGDGTVISAGWGGAGGNTVKIRHNSVYTTAYLHLQKFASGIKAGAMVHQGQVIGYVGSTGTSTGPHLDFRVWQNGSPINPLTMEAPSAEPIKEEFRAALDSAFAAGVTEMDSLAVFQKIYDDQITQ